jgi:hypothetical protein
MDYRLTPEQEAFQKEFSSWVDENIPDGFDPSKRRNFKTIEAHVAAYKEFQNRLLKPDMQECTIPQNTADKARR